jgi:DNA mismatch repair protein MutS
MNQYRDIKSRYGDGILFFQVGDFYETFYEDARLVSRLLNIALTTRDKGKKDQVPLAGVPVHAAEGYIAKLLQAGRKVIICDQADDTPGASGVVKRVVTDIVTPGTTLSPATLHDNENNYILSMIEHGERIGFSVLDVSTGELRAGEGTGSSVEHMLAGYRIREAIVPDGAATVRRIVETIDASCTIDPLPPHEFESPRASEALRAHFALRSPAGLGLEDAPLAEAASGALLRFVKELRQSDLRHVVGVRLLVPDETLFLDRETLKNLELFEPLRGNTPESTLIHYMDRTETAMGARELRQRLSHPSRRIAVISKSLDAISAFCAEQAGLREIRAALRHMPDMERALGRIATRKANPRELLALAEALHRVPALARVARRLDAKAFEEASVVLSTPISAGDIIAQGIEPDCPPYLRNGGVIRKGFRDDLDLLLRESADGKSWIANLQESERERTAIPSLKVGYNRVFGYYIEVPRAHTAKVPADYQTKQTLVSSQRYVTEALKEKEQTILAADAKRVELEREIFDAICESVEGESEAIRRVAAAVAELDVLSALATIALERNYSRPAMNDHGDLVIVEGRHPVVELISGRDFIPNDLELRSGEKTFLTITGPNMGGKSTYIRQAALIALLAHAGSFVPASRASICLLDRIFTRVGSSDNVAGGQSTFLVEMGETAKILRNCTSESLVVLDEVGRGTSTLDGLSIAWAVSEFLMQDAGRRPKTLFATHYHELTKLAETHPCARNARVQVREWGDGVVFLYKVEDGASDRSYGIHVARLAGLPEPVIRRANEILASLERRKANERTSEKAPEAPQPSLFEPGDELRNALLNIDIENITPIDALTLLANLQRTARDRQG